MWATPMKDVTPIGAILGVAAVAAKNVDLLQVIGAGKAGCPYDLLSVFVGVARDSSAAVTGF